MLDRTTETWPADYRAAMIQRSKVRAIIQQELDKDFERTVAALKMRYGKRPFLFIRDWAVVSEPRIASGSALTLLPFIPFARQVELIQFIHALLKDLESGLVEKSRDMGATWTCVWISIWLFLFWSGAVIGWGSRGSDEVDQIGNPDSILEKVRIGLRNIPWFLLPKGFSYKEHMSFMRITNPETGAMIRGDVGDNIGRGGRSLIYFKDEAQPLDAQVLTVKGFCFMGDIEPGNYVIGGNGFPTKVTHVKECGVHQVYRITFSDGTWTEASPNHLWHVERIYGKKKLVVLRTHELVDDYLYESPGGQVHYKFRLPIVSDPVVFGYDTTEPSLFFTQPGKAGYFLDPYIVGALLGDGTVTNVPKESPRMSTVDEEIVREFERLLPEGCIVSSWNGKGFRIIDERDRHDCNRWSKSRARQAVAASGISGLCSYDKKIPGIYKFASPERRLHLLQGLMDTDGSASNGGSATFHTASPQLAEDVKFIVRSLGGIAFHNVKPDKRGFVDQHVITVRLPEGLCPFRLSRKKNALRQKKKGSNGLSRRIASIVPVGRKPVRCITVEAKDGLYVTDNFIVTHNSAHYVHPEMVEGALSENAAIQVDISSVYGIGTVFHRRREAGVDWYPGAELPKGRTRVFVMDWRQHPGKTQEWYDLKRQKAEDEGLLHVFAQEVDRDYSAAVEGVIIQAQWIQAAIDAHVRLGLRDDGLWGAGLDVADEGLDTNAITVRKGIICKEVGEWGARDPGVTTRNVINSVEDILPLELQYDSVGLGVSVKSEYNRLIDEKKVPKGLKLIPWNAGAEPLWKEKPVNPRDKKSPLNGDFFQNLKAQAWFNVAIKFQKTWRVFNDPEFAKGMNVGWTPDEIISIDSKSVGPILHKLVKELSQPTWTKSQKLKMMVDKKPDGAKSPNLGDSFVMAYFPAIEKRPLHIPPKTLERARLPNIYSLNRALSRRR